MQETLGPVRTSVAKQAAVEIESRREDLDYLCLTVPSTLRGTGMDYLSIPGRRGEVPARQRHQAERCMTSVWKIRPNPKHTP